MSSVSTSGGYAAGSCGLGLSPWPRMSGMITRCPLSTRRAAWPLRSQATVPVVKSVQQQHRAPLADLSVRQLHPAVSGEVAQLGIGHGVRSLVCGGSAPGREQVMAAALAAYIARSVSSTSSSSAAPGQS